MPIWAYNDVMARAATTTDVFNAIVVTLGFSQPAISKHLAVLGEVGIVSTMKHGQQRLYHLCGKELKPVHD